MHFKNKVCVLTGGALGIGRCITRKFAESGAKIVFIDINQKAAQKNAEYINHNGGESHYFIGDISNEVDLLKFKDFTLNLFPTIDYLINNACINKKGILSACTFEDFNYVLKVGICAPYFLTHQFLKSFKPGSSIVNIGSTRAYMSQADTESYTSAKGGILSLTHALAISLAGKVRVNCISPGWIDTSKYYDDNYTLNHEKPDIEQHPAKRIGKAEDIANVVMFLCNEENSFITGENITVDGGMTKLMIYNGDDGWTLK